MQTHWRARTERKRSGRQLTLLADQLAERACACLPGETAAAAVEPGGATAMRRSSEYRKGGTGRGRWWQGGGKGHMVTSGGRVPVPGASNPRVRHGSIGWLCWHERRHAGRDGAHANGAERRHENTNHLHALTVGCGGLGLGRAARLPACTGTIDGGADAMRCIMINGVMLRRQEQQQQQQAPVQLVARRGAPATLRTRLLPPGPHRHRHCQRTTGHTHR